MSTLCACTDAHSYGAPQVEHPEHYSFYPRELMPVVVKALTTFAQHPSFVDAAASGPHLNETFTVLRRACRIGERHRLLSEQQLWNFQDFVTRLMSTPQASAAAASHGSAGAGPSGGAGSRDGSKVAPPDVEAADASMADEYVEALRPFKFVKSTALRLDASAPLELDSHFMPLVKQNKVARRGKLKRVRRYGARHSGTVRTNACLR